MEKSYFNLSTTESAVVQAAAQIYAAHITAGHVTDGAEASWIQRSVHDAILIARATDDAVVSNEEVDSSDAQNIGNISMGRVRGRRSRMSE